MENLLELQIRGLITKYLKEALTYQKQVDECRAKNLPHDQMLATAGTYRMVAKDLDTLLKDYAKTTQKTLI